MQENIMQRIYRAIDILNQLLHVAKDLRKVAVKFQTGIASGILRTIPRDNLHVVIF